MAAQWAAQQAAQHALRQPHNPAAQHQAAQWAAHAAAAQPPGQGGFPMPPGISGSVGANMQVPSSGHATAQMPHMGQTVYEHIDATTKPTAGEKTSYEDKWTDESA